MHKMMPPLNPLRAFEVAGRHVSFTRAADELGVTQTAVSRQVAVLESYLHTRLFERNNSELTITDAGRSYLQSVQPALEMIAEATGAMRAGSNTVLKVRCFLTFGIRWLLPRLPRFRELHPKIDINITTSILPADFKREDIDVNICHGDGNWPDAVALRIFEDQVTPVCNPSLLEREGAPRTPADLCRQSLLHSRARPGDWADWLQHVGVLERVAPALMFETSSLVYEAARQGLGFAIGQVPLLRNELARGELAAPFPVMRRSPSGYYLLHRPGRVEAKTQLFRSWLLQEAADDAALTESFRAGCGASHGALRSGLTDGHAAAVDAASMAASSSGGGAAVVPYSVGMHTSTTV